MKQQPNTRQSAFGTKTIRSIAFLIVAFMFAVFAVVYVTQVSITNAYQHFEELATVGHDVDALTKALVDQETGERGYQLTGLKPFLQPYIAGTAAYNATAHRLLQEVDDTELRPGVIQMIQVGDAWHRQVVVGKTITKSGKSLNAISAMEQGRATINHFQVLSGQVSRWIEAHQARDERTISSYGRVETYLSFLLVTIFGSLSLWLTLRRFRRLIDPINELSVVVEQYATGHVATPMSDVKDDELRELIQRVDHILSEYRQRMHESDYLSNHDALTGLWSRRHFDEVITEVIRNGRLRNEPLTMMMIDVDYFKQCNDLYGHLEGDRVLRTVGDVIAGQIRSTDVACRFGGEEFSVLLPNTEMTDAIIIAERLREQVESTVRTGFSTVTISVGVSECTPTDTPETLIARTDSALYEAKQLGRNRVLSA